jgi:hypothetical protein
MHLVYDVSATRDAGRIAGRLTGWALRSLVLGNLCHQVPLFSMIHFSKNRASERDSGEVVPFKGGPLHLTFPGELAER